MSTSELPYPEYKDGRVVCQECGKTFLELSRHLTAGHDDVEGKYEYREKYGENVPLIARGEFNVDDINSSIDEMTCEQIIDQIEYIDEQMEKLESRLVRLEESFENRRQKVEELNNIFERVTK